jgi:hypothetical protein
MDGSRMRVLIACEYSGRVRDAFTRKGHFAMSADLLPSDRPGKHHQGSVMDIINDDWDLMIGHPPCTFMANSSAKHLYKDMKKENGRNEKRWSAMKQGAEFFKSLWSAPIPKICLENPVMLGHAKKLIGVNQTQIIQPWQFGHGETKQTCLWLKGLEPLEPSSIVSGRDHRVHKMPPSADRWKLRSTTFQGIADAFADQWG